ncbi:MAG: YlxR family protein [Defluviitaleaceae bacterium]|nr:YlxR family protein [Defluviitaleaceae bacterium]
MKRIPQRKCVACREMRDKTELLRVSLPSQGRGAYICKNSVCIEQARKTKGLDRSLKGTVPPDIYVQLKESVS